MNSPFQVQPRPRADDTAIVEQLLLRYPAISASELATLIEIFRKLPLIDAALMTTDERLSKPLEAFHEDHGHIFRAPVKSLLALLAFPFVAIGALWWLVS